MQWTKAVVLGGVLVWTGCAAPGSYTLQKAGAQIPVGTQIEIAAPFSYPAGRTTLWFRVLVKSGVWILIQLLPDCPSSPRFHL